MNQRQRQRQQQKTIILWLWLLYSCMKIIAFPCYKSTDYYVHRHWKSITYHITYFHDWYYDDQFVTTRHTVDYPPGFILYVENFWSNVYYPIVQTIVLHFRERRRERRRYLVQQEQQQQQEQTEEVSLLERDKQSNYPWMDNNNDNDNDGDGEWSNTISSNLDQCLQLFSDHEIESSSKKHHPVDHFICVAFMRSTVILSDIILWLGAYLVSVATACSCTTTITTTIITTNSGSTSGGTNIDSVGKGGFSWMLFVLLVSHPGLFWLDHVHFQYNGLLLGILLLSIGCCMHANNNSNEAILDTNTTTATTTTTTTSGTNNSSSTKNNFREHGFHLGAAILFAILLSMKHLYLTLSLWYASYLFRRYCCMDSTSANTRIRREKKDSTDQRIDISKDTGTVLFVNWWRFTAVAVVSAGAFFAPFVPFLISAATATNAEGMTASTAGIKSWLAQLLRRLFPFQRGLLHDYWAGNVWAIYAGACKFITAILHATSHRMTLSPSAIQPNHCVALLLLGCIPGAVSGWYAAASATMTKQQHEQQQHQHQNPFNDKRKSNSVMLLSLSYTAFVSFLVSYHVHEKAIMTAILPLTIWAVHSSTWKDLDGINCAWTLLWEVTATGLLGLFPLLYRPQEFLLKISMYVTYLAGIDMCRIRSIRTKTNDYRIIHDSNTNMYHGSRRLVYIIVLSIVIFQLDIAPLRYLYGRYEFAPLAITSLTCAVGLILQFFHLTYILVQETRSLWE